MRRLRLFLAMACPVFLQVACSGHAELPRFTKLDAFDPHRPTFECKHEAETNPPTNPQAESLFQQGLTVTSYDLWPEDRDYKKAALLWQEAAAKGHWKAQLNLAGLYLQGNGVTQDAEKAVQLTEDLMRKGAPAAWDNMGTYYMGGVGPVKQDATVAYAFWQKAADIGSMAAQTYLGAKLLGVDDQPPDSWANKTVGIKMLQCAFAQGFGKAAYELGMEQRLLGEKIESTNQQALTYLHDGVKLGSRESSISLAATFRAGAPLVNRQIDTARADRYSVLGDALARNPDLRFPNLDKVLPLPPADLPLWDGKKQTLIDAAKALVRAPAMQPGPGNQYPKHSLADMHLGFGLPRSRAP